MPRLSRLQKRPAPRSAEGPAQLFYTCAHYDQGTPVEDIGTCTSKIRRQPRCMLIAAKRETTCPQYKRREDSDGRNE